MPVIFTKSTKTAMFIGFIFGGLGLVAGVVAPLVTVEGPMKFMGLAMALVFVFIWSKIFKHVLKPILNQDKIYKTGEAATATLIKAWETNTRINGKPYVGMLVEVTLSGEVYQVETKSVVSLLEIIHYQPGAKLHVRVSPMNKNHVVVVGLAEPPTLAATPLGAARSWS